MLAAASPAKSAPSPEESQDPAGGTEALGDAKEIVSSVQGLEELDGQVILMHSLYKSTVEAVEVLVPWLQEQGYELVTVSELLERRFGETPEAGRFYDAHFFWSVLPREPKNYSNYKAS